MITAMEAGNQLVKNVGHEVLLKMQSDYTRIL